MAMSPGPGSSGSVDRSFNLAQYVDFSGMEDLDPSVGA
jgi:hypothetical protein